MHFLFLKIKLTHNIGSHHLWVSMLAFSLLFGHNQS